MIDEVEETQCVEMSRGSQVTSAWKASQVDVNMNRNFGVDHAEELGEQAS
jgi:hypothetical protein